MTCKSLHILDGYQLNVADGYGYTSPWVDVLTSAMFSFSVIFTGGTPLGSLQLQQSNDIPVDSSLAGGAAKIYPQWALPNNSSNFISDAANVPSGSGVDFAMVNGAGAYVLNQYYATSSWVRIVYTSQVSSATQLDIRMTRKSLGT